MRVVPTRLRVFGGAGLEIDGESVGVGGPRQRRLLALLVIRSGEVVDIDWLAEYLWTDGDRPDPPAPALRTYVSRLRQSFPEPTRDWVVTEPAGYRLHAPPDAVEHLRFGELRTRARDARESGDPETARRLLDEALGLWRGDPFRELEDLDWARGEIERLRLDRLEALEERWEVALDLGRHTQITGELAAFTAEHRLRERAARQYALALYRSGRTSEALRVIDDHRRTLAEESGLEPSPAVLDLEDAILSGSPSLDVEQEGRPLRGYRLLDEIGSGAFATVWRAVQPSVGREVAIKQIRSELASQPEFIRRFEAEAHLVARIEHPHIVPLIDFWRDPDSAYLVMRWLRGGTLERHIDDGPLPLDRVLEIAGQVGAALSTAHDHGVIHRDVKPSNVMFDELGNAYLTDFGIALAVAESGGPEAALSQGSPAYASPEQLRRERLGPGADVFSLGVVVYECVAGALPFPDGASADELVRRQLEEPFPPLDEVRSDLPAGIAEAVARATAKDAADRFESVADFLGALRSHTPAPDQAGPPAATGEAPLVGAANNPYVGLRAFEDADSGRFFGRRRLVSELVGRLSGETVTSRCLIVVGPSGSGKSSAVRAGLVPAIRSGAVPGSEDWYTTTMMPGGDPFESLEAALLRIAVNPPTTLLDQLSDGPRGILRGLRRCIPDDSHRVLLVIDQFEEVFVGRSADRSARFLDALAVAADDPGSPLRLVATLRADFYHRPLEHQTFAPILKQTAVDVTPLAPDELEEAIVEPARRAGVGFEPGLVARIAAETIGQPSPLPLLQYALSELFERRSGRMLTGAAYDELGGLTGALAARAEALFAAGSDEQRAAIRRIFGRMTDPGQERTDLRRRVPITDLGDDAAVVWVLRSFGEARLISFDRDVGTREPTVEVAHEALLREWPRLASWLEEDRDLLRSIDLLATAANTWDDAGRQPADLYRGGRLEQALDLALTASDRLRPLDRAFIDASRSRAEAERESERRRVRRLRRLNVGVSLALVMALVAGGLAVGQRNEARAATERAELSTLVSRSAAIAGEDVDLSILLALEAHRRSPGLETERAILDAIGKAPGRSSRIPLLDGPSDPCADQPNHLWVSDDGLRGYQTVGDRMLSIDLESGQVVDHGRAPEPCVMWFGDEASGVRWAGFHDGGVHDGFTHWFGPFDGPLVRIERDAEFWLAGRNLTQGRLLFVSEDEMMIVDATTGDVVGDPIPIGADPRWRPWGMSPDGRLAAITGISGGGGYLDPVQLIDTLTGEEIARYRLEQSPTAVAFDDRSRRLAVGGLRGRVVTIELDTGRVIGNVETSEAEGFRTLGFRPDGLIVGVTEGRIELVDPLVGPVRPPVDIDGVREAHIRRDGTIVLLDSQMANAEIVNLESTALVRRAWDIAPSSTVQFGHGKAGVVDPSGGAAVVDLTTGARIPIALQGPDGRPFRPTAVFPEEASIVAFGDDATVGRWSDGQLTEFLELGQPVMQPTFYREDRLEVEAGPGPAFAGQGAVVVHSRFERNYEDEVYTVEWSDGPITARLATRKLLIESALPAGDGGVHVMDPHGRMRTYDASGRWRSEITTTLRFPWATARNEAGGLVAFGGIGGAVIIDPASGEQTPIPGLGAVSSVGFVEDRDLLVVVEASGTIRLWNVASNASAGVLWNGSGGASASPPWFDADSGTLWVASSGRLLAFDLDPARWIETACGVVDRELTPEEWDRFVPGDGPQQSACG